MTCCKCQQYSWYARQHTEYTDENGNEYCVFHAPEGHKVLKNVQLSVKQFNRLVYGYIHSYRVTKRRTNTSTRCQLSGTIFPGDISFSQYHEDNKCPPLDLSSSIFCGEVSFSGTTFEDSVWFEHVYFSKSVEFSNTAFGSTASFLNSTFEKQVTFLRTTFNSDANFTGTTFIDRSQFELVNFRGVALFKSVKFLSSSTFNNSIFYSTIDFSLTTFTEDASFERVKFFKNTLFSSTMFLGRASFKWSSFAKCITISDTKFVKETSFALAIFNTTIIKNTSFGQVADFHRSQFCKHLAVNGSEFHRQAIFKKCRFFSAASFISNSFSRTIDFKKAVFLHPLELKSSKFNGSVIFMCASIHGGASFNSSRFNSDVDFNRSVLCNNVDFNDVRAKQNSIRMHNLSTESIKEINFSNIEADFFSFNNCTLPEQFFIERSSNKSIKSCEDFYRKLKQKAESEQNRPMVSRWHHREKLMGLEQVKERCPYFWWLHWLGMYYWTSGFGERWIPASLCLLGMLLFCLFLLGLGGVHGGGFVIQGPALPSWENIQNFGSVCLSLLKYLLLIKEESIKFKPIHGAAEFLILLFTRLVIPIQAAFFAIALRNAYRR